MTKDTLRDNLEKVAQLAEGSFFGRLWQNPWRYIQTQWHSKFVYKITKSEKVVVGNTFYGQALHLALPASSDIYLNGGKSHDSEIRLAHFLINELKEGDSYIDIGAHIGYFVALAALLVCEKGAVLAFEPAPSTRKLLLENTKSFTNVRVSSNAVSHIDGTLTFYEFPNLYSEFNTTDISMYQDEPWFKLNPPKVHTLDSITLDHLWAENKWSKPLIKIDVEGAEDKVMLGAVNMLQSSNPTLVMEYILPVNNSGDTSHGKAVSMLNSLGYQSYCINNKGILELVENIEYYMRHVDLHSDNIVFKR